MCLVIVQTYDQGVLNYVREVKLTRCEKIGRAFKKRSKEAERELYSCHLLPHMINSTQTRQDNQTKGG